MIAAPALPKLIAAAGFHLLAVALLAMAVTLCWRPRLWLPLLGLFLGLLIGFVDMLSHQAQLPALMLLATCFFLAFAQPRLAWRWALLVGIWVPIGGLLQWALKAPVVESTVHPGAGFLALIPAFVGAYAGVGAAAIAARQKSSSMLNGTSTQSLP